MNPQLPRAGDAPTSGDDSRPQAIILRDVVMQGRVALPRPRGGESQQGSAGSHQAVAPLAQGPSLVPVHAVRRAEPPVLPQAAVSDATRLEEEARQRGYEEGFAKGSVEGRARGDEEARQRAAQAAEKAARDQEDHTERLVRELKQEAQAAYQARVRVLEGLIAALPPEIDARLAAVEEDMLALCFEVVCRVLGESVAQPGAVKAQLLQATEKLRSRQMTAIHMHPDDLALLQKAQGSVLGSLGGSDVQWIASTEVELGGCILQSPEGGLDARFETQLSALRELLLQTRAAARAQEA